MIIQCRQCRTRFRFDETLMENDGMWMRCSRCQHVFFQDNPSKLHKPAVSPQAAPVLSQEPSLEKAPGRLSFEAAGVAQSPAAPDEDVKSFLQDVISDKKTGGGEAEPEWNIPKTEGMSLDDIEVTPEPGDLDETGLQEQPLEEAPSTPVRKKRWFWIAAIWAVLVILVIPGILYFLVFPEQGKRLTRMFAAAPQQADAQFVTGQVKIQDVQQRVINNYMLGNIRVVEGTAINQADFSIARIKVKAEMLDAYSVVLDSRVCYAGNILTDDELMNMTEEEMQRRLSLPEGRENSNERVIPNGQIPFMIIFTPVPQSAIKTTVVISGAERLL